MTDRIVTDKLVGRIFGWHPAPDRFMTGERGWIARSRFRPFKNVRDALRLADALTRRYSLTSHLDGFTAEINHHGRVGRATAGHQARAIMLALAQVVDLEVPGSIGGKPPAIDPACESELIEGNAR